MIIPKTLIMEVLTMSENDGKKGTLQVVPGLGYLLASVDMHKIFFSKASELHLNFPFMIVVS